MTPKQKRFCDEYLIDLNATQAALRAGYSKKTAYAIGNKLLKEAEIKACLDAKLEEMESKTIAKATEVMQYLTSVMRGESRASVLCLCGEGMQEVIEKAPDEKERLKAAEMLARRYALLSDKVSVDGSVPVVISGGDELEE